LTTGHMSHPGRPNVEGHGHEDHEVTIETLSTPPVHVKPAPLTKRVAAGLVDSALLAAAWVVVLILTVKDFTLAETTSVYTGAAYLAVLTFFYYFLLEWFLAASIGKLLLKLRVFGTDGEPCSMSASFKRNLLRFVD